VSLVIEFLDNVLYTAYQARPPVSVGGRLDCRAKLTHGGSLWRRTYYAHAEWRAIPYRTLDADFAAGWLQFDILDDARSGAWNIHWLGHRNNHGNIWRLDDRYLWVATSLSRGCTRGDAVSGC